MTYIRTFDAILAEAMCTGVFPLRSHSLCFVDVGQADVAEEGALRVHLRDGPQDHAPERGHPAPALTAVLLYVYGVCFRMYVCRCAYASYCFVFPE